MESYQEIELQECPICGGAGLMEEENGWCFYVACLDCGSHTAEIRYERPFWATPHNCVCALRRIFSANPAV